MIKTARIFAVLLMWFALSASSPEERALEQGEKYARTQNYDRAIAEYGKVIEMNPRSVDAYYRRGIVYALKEDYARAIYDYTKVIDLDPNMKEVYYNRANAYLMTRTAGNVDRAIQDYTVTANLIRKSDDTSRLEDIHFNRAYAYLMKGDVNNALKDLDVTIELDPSRPAAYYYRSKILFDKRDLERALSDINKCIELDPAKPHSYIL